MALRRPIKNKPTMTSSENDFDSEAGTSNVGRYGQIKTDNNKSSLEISSHDDADDDHNSTDVNNNDNTSLAAKYRQEKQLSKVRHWKEGQYAAGLVEPTWSDELERYNREGRSGCCCCCPASAELDQMFREEIDPGCGCIYLSAVVCSRLGAERIGNMAVLKSKYVMVEVDDDMEGEDEEFINDDEEALQLGSDESKRKQTRRMMRKREIQFVVGPFWPMLLGITYPLIFGVSGLTLFVGLPYRVWYVKVVWTVLTVALIWSLFNTGFRDPGILTRHKDPPENDEEEGDTPKRRIGFRWGTEGGPWRWSEQSQSYRPRNSSYDPDCAVVVEEFDHTCPWTGTAIGKKNMRSFQMFVALVFLCLIMDILLLTAPAKIDYSK